MDNTQVNNKHILVAEDEQAMSGTLSLKLEHSGFTVTVAHNGEEAIELLAANQFDLVLLDIMMPKVNGFEVLEHMRQNSNTVPVIMTTNLSQDEDIQRAKDLGVVGYIVKSNTSLSDIVAQVNAVVSQA